MIVKVVEIYNEDDELEGFALLVDQTNKGLELLPTVYGGRTEAHHQRETITDA